MKLLVSALAISIGMSASEASAELTLNVDGEDYTLTTLMENCQSLASDPPAQIACFGVVSKLVEEQSNKAPEIQLSVPEAFEALRTAAQYQDEETGLLVAGTECTIQVLYYNNYFHISRRNVSSIDVFSATFDASQVKYDQISEIRGAQAPLFRGLMATGGVATMRGGVALDSSQNNFKPKSARTSIGDYAIETINQLAVKEGPEFDFVLVHPAKSQSSEDIWNSFETFAKACQR